MGISDASFAPRSVLTVSFCFLSVVLTYGFFSLAIAASILSPLILTH